MIALIIPGWVLAVALALAVGLGGFVGLVVAVLCWVARDDREQLANAERPIDSESLFPKRFVRVCPNVDCGAVTAAERCPLCGRATLAIPVPADPRHCAMNLLGGCVDPPAPTQENPDAR